MRSHDRALPPSPWISTSGLPAPRVSNSIVDVSIVFRNFGPTPLFPSLLNVKDGDRT